MATERRTEERTKIDVAKGARTDSAGETPLATNAQINIVRIHRGGARVGARATKTRAKTLRLCQIGRPRGPQRGDFDGALTVQERGGRGRDTVEARVSSVARFGRRTGRRRAGERAWARRVCCGVLRAELVMDRMKDRR